MKTSPPLSRRELLQQGAVIAASALAATRLSAAPQEAAAVGPKYPVIAFSKPFAHLNAAETADLVAEVGWDGIDCPVRTKAGQIKPERVEEDLPRMHEALHGRGKQLAMITTEIVKLDASAEKVLRTASKLGIKRYRLGFIKYAKDKPIPQTLREVTAWFKDLAALNKELGIYGGYQNHSGGDYFGAPVWDLWTAIKDLPPGQIGICFDIAHATMEGGLSWPIEARLVEPSMVAVFLKDFRWEKKADKGWQPVWCPFGEGAVRREFLTNLKKSAFAGPLCQHHEYEIGTGAEMVRNLKRDLATLREWIA
jgi:sugar phosphate isomerase/epimerase